MSDLDELSAEAEIGDAAKVFMESELGRVILGIAEQEVRLAEIALGKVDPDNKKEIVRLQNEIALGDRFPQWLNELFQKGNVALEIYQHEKRSRV